MKILITGAAGLIGSNLCQSLLSSGHKVFGVDNFITGSRDNIKKLKHHKNFSFLELDISKSNSKKAIESQMPKIDQIYHLACPTGVPNLTKLAFEMLETCSLGTWNIMEIAKKNKSKVVFTSSSEVYGDPEKFPQKENYNGNVDSTGIRSVYEEGKRFAETVISAYNRKYNVDARIVRIFNTYGPGMSKTDTRVITRFINQAITNKPLEVHGKGEQKRTFCMVDDLVKSLITVMEKGKKGGVYNIGSDKEISIGELAKVVINITNSKSTIKFVPRLPHDHQRRRPDLTNIHSLGWAQTSDLKSGLIKTLEWYKS